MRVKSGIVAAVAALVSVGAVSYVVAIDHDPQQAMPLPVEQVTTESTPSTPQPSLSESPSESANPGGVDINEFFPAFAYSDDGELPQPAPVHDQPMLDYIDTPGGKYLAIPVNGYRSSEFGPRFHPVLRQWRLHTGLDFATSCGTPVGAAAPGRVTFVGWGGGNGNMVTIDHGTIAGYHVQTRYGHLSSASVKVGQQVARQQAIGRVGNTGLSTGCHLHFEVLANGQFTDPARWLNGEPVLVDTARMMEEYNFEPSPTAEESPSPSPSPSLSPSEAPSESPSPTPPPPTSEPSEEPSGPTSEPSGPSDEPSDPSGEPSEPTDEPSGPSGTPSESPSGPSGSPSNSEEPSESESAQEQESPSGVPSPTP